MVAFIMSDTKTFENIFTIAIPRDNACVPLLHMNYICADVTDMDVQMFAVYMTVRVWNVLETFTHCGYVEAELDRTRHKTSEICFPL